MSPKPPERRLALPQASERFLTEREAATFLRLSARTMQRRRRDGTGPKFVRMGARIRYRVRDVAEWTNANTHARTNAEIGDAG